MSIPVPVGGLLLSSFGGVLGFRTFQGALPAAGQEPPIVDQLLLDHQNSQLELESIEHNTTQTGAWGAEGTGVVARRWRCMCNLLWDAANPPDPLTCFGEQALFSDNLDLGFQFWFYGSSSLNYPSDIRPSYYFCPSAKRRFLGPATKAGPTPEFVTARIVIVGNAPLFFMPLAQTQYDNYIEHCRTRGWVW